MYRGLTVKTPGCVAFSLPVQRRNLHSEDSSVFPIPPRPAQRAADKERRFRARAASGPRLPSCSRDGFRHGKTDYWAARPDMRWPASALAPRRAFSDRQGGALPPTCSDGPTLDAPDCIAGTPGKNTADAGRKPRASLSVPGIMFGEARRIAFRPSPHPRIRWTVASSGRAICARRPARPPPSRVPKCPTKCLSMPPTRRRPGSLWSAATASKNLISRPLNASNCVEISISPRSRA